MPPLKLNLFDSDCQATPGVGQLFDSLLSTSISTLSPMCNLSPGRVYSPTYPMDQQESSASAASTVALKFNTCSACQQSTAGSSSVVTSSDPKRPLTNHIRPQAMPYRNQNRKNVGLSLNVSTSTSDHPYHLPSPPPGHNGPPPPLISCSRNVEFRRKSLPERHFFRPVSEDESSMGVKN